MSKKTQLMEEIRMLLAMFASDIRTEHASIQGDVHSKSEEVVAYLLQAMYDYSFPGRRRMDLNRSMIDLYDEEADGGMGVAVHVTQSNTRQEAIHTIQRFTEHHASGRLCDHYKTLMIVILSMDEKFSGWDRIGSDDCTVRIVNLLDLCEKMEQSGRAIIQEIHDFLRYELRYDPKNEFPRTCVESVGVLLDIQTVTRAQSDCTEEDVRRFYMVDSNFPRMLRVVGADRDVPHQQIDKKLGALCIEGRPTILVGDSGTGKSTMMLRAAVSWIRSGNVAVWIRFDDAHVLSDFTSERFYKSLRQMISGDQRVLVCLDNPTDNPAAFRALARSWQGDEWISLVMAERCSHLLEMVEPGSDLLRGWFSDACVVALLPEDSSFYVKNYEITYTQDTIERKKQILEQTVSALDVIGSVKRGFRKNVVQQVMLDSDGMKASLVELIYRVQFKLRDFASKPERIRMDWDEWKNFLRKKLGINKSSDILYGVIALCSLYEVPISVDLYCKVCEVPTVSLCSALQKENGWENGIGPVLYHRDSNTLAPKNSVAADLFFQFKRGTLDYNALMSRIIDAMHELELADLLQKMVQKSRILSGRMGVLEDVHYRDYLIRIYQRVMDGHIMLDERTKTYLALGLIYTVGQKYHTVMGSQTLDMVSALGIGAGSDRLTIMLYTEWGMLEARQGLNKNAEEKLRLTVASAPSLMLPRIELARLLAKQAGREAEAEAYLRETIRIDPKNVQSRIELGRFLANQAGREAEAEAYLRETIRIDPKNVPSCIELGRLLSKQPGREAEAEAYLRETIRIDPKNVPSCIELGRLLAKQAGREAEAEAYLRKTIRIDPKNVQSRIELGRFLANQAGREAEAEVFLRETIRIAPKNIPCRTELGRLLAKQPGRESETEQILREAISIDLHNLPNRLILAQLFARQGRYDEAELMFREILKIDPGNLYARNGLKQLVLAEKAAEAETAPLSPAPSITTISEAKKDQPVGDTMTQQEQSEADALDELSELKIIFLGDGEAGKTLTIARLRNNGEIPGDFDGHTTPGIAISEIKYEISGETVKANIWDFGGQEILHSMHRMFLTGRTLYVVVLNAREDNMDNRAKYWLQNLKSLANEPSVLLVINKIDGNPKAAVNEPELRKLYPQLGRIIKMSALKFTKDEFNRTFTDVLYEQISDFDSLRTPLPTEWKRLKARIKETKTDIISNDDFLRYCRECGIDDDPSARGLILELFRDLGICFWYGEPAKDNHIILSPYWITNAIYMILFNEHSDLNNGILPRKSIQTLLCSRKKNTKTIHRIIPDMVYRARDVDYVLSVIRQFSLSYPLEKREEFFPMLCNRNTPAIVKEYLENPAVLEFHVEYDYLPSNVMHNLMVMMQKDLSTDVVWYSGAKFVDMKVDCTAVARANEHTMEIYIRPESEKALPFVYLRKFLDMIEGVNTNLLLYSRKRCIAYKADGIKQYFDYTNLVKGLARGISTVYSENHDRSVHVSEILNPNSSCDPDREELIGNVVIACRNLQRNKRYWDWHENGMNCYMREMLEMKDYVVRDQTLSGTGASGANDGELDLDVRKTAHQPWTIIEAMCIKDHPEKSNWNKHLKKLLIDYNRNGIPFLVQVCYVRCERRVFERLSRTHMEHLKKHAPPKYTIHNSIPIETVPFGYEQNNLMFGAECTYVLDKGESISRTTICHLFVYIGDEEKHNKNASLNEGTDKIAAP